MKKALLIFLIVTLVLGCILITFFVSIGQNKKIVYATSFDCDISSLSLEIGDTYCFSADNFSILPSNCTESVLYSTNDNKIISIDVFTGKIEAKNIGTCNIFLYIKSSENENIKNTINVSVVEKITKILQKIIEKNVKFSISESFAMISYETDSSFSECNYILEDEGIITISEFDYKRIIIKFCGVGTTTIIINSPTLITKIFVEITN